MTIIVRIFLMALKYIVSLILYTNMTFITILKPILKQF